MGADQSHEFGDQVMGVVVALLAPQLDTSLEFVSLGSIQDETRHKLPYVVEPSDASASKAQSIDDYVQLYSNYYDSSRQAAIDKYLKESVLDSPEHTQAFLKLLVTRLTPQTSRKQHNTMTRHQDPSEHQMQEHLKQQQLQQQQLMQQHQQLMQQHQQQEQEQHQTMLQMQHQHQAMEQQMQRQAMEMEQAEHHPEEPQLVMNAEHVEARGQAKLQRRINTMLSKIDNDEALKNWRQQQIRQMEDAMASNPDLPESPENRADKADLA